MITNTLRIKMTALVAAFIVVPLMSGNTANRGNYFQGSQIMTAAASEVSTDYCPPNSPPLDVILLIGDLGTGLPLPQHYSNGSKDPVTFTVTMKENLFFGPEKVVFQRTVEPGIELVVHHLFISVDESTPVGTDTVVIEVTSSATGEKILGRCTFNLTVIKRQNVIEIPLRLCVLEGTDLAFDLKSSKPIPPGQFAPAGEVIKLIGQMNDKSWLKYAGIAFRTAIAAGVPVIKDPDTGPFNGIPTKPGWVEVPAFGGITPTTEPGTIVTACQNAWQNADPSQKGIVIVFVGRFLNAGNVLGFVPSAQKELIQSAAGLPNNNSTRLCQQPRQLQVGDLTRVGFSLLLEPTASIPTNSFEGATQALAHELGHALLLGHGNGLDDDGNGGLPPGPGPRRFDEYCDTKGLASDGTPLEDSLTPFVSCEETASLMHVTAPCQNLRPLQIEQARAAAKLVPGAVFDSSIDPAGAFVADLDDPSYVNVPVDVLVAGVEVAETPDLGLTEIAQTVVGALPGTASNRYTTVVDLDNDSATGCDPSELGLPTAFSGAELVASVMLEAVSGQSFQLTPTAWKCEAGSLVPLSASEIEAKASDVELADAGGHILGRIEVEIPSALVGPRSDIVRVQAFAEQLAGDMLMSRLPPSPDAGGLIILPAPSLPKCAVLDSVVNPGSITRVQAEGLPPNEPVEVLLGGDLVGSGEVDNNGIVDVELAILSTSPQGTRPVTVQVSDTLYLATCVVDVIGDPVTPVTVATISPEPNPAGWNHTDVTVTLTASSQDAAITSLTYSSTGAQTIPETTIAGEQVVIPITEDEFQPAEFAGGVCSPNMDGGVLSIWTTK